MLTFLCRRLLISCGVLFLVSIISYLIITLSPGSPFPWGDLNPQISPAIKEEYRKRFHLHRPIHEQYWRTMSDLVSGRLVSMKDQQPVFSKIKERMPATLGLAVTALMFVYGFGLVLGIQSAKHQGRWPDIVVSLVAFASTAVPGFWIAYLVILALANVFHLPVLGTETIGMENGAGLAAFFDRVWHLLIPAFVLSLVGIAAQTRYLRATLIEVLREDYIRTARAKGASPDAILFRHALPHGLRPLITSFGISLPALLSGSIIIETIFAWPGIGRLGYEAVLERDYPLLVALNLVAAILVLLGNLFSDILYAAADPRVRLQ